MVGDAGLLRRDEVGQALVGDAVAVLPLLAQAVQGREHRGPGLVGVDLDVVADAVGREDADDPRALSQCSRSMRSSMRFASSRSVRACSDVAGLFRTSG